MSCKDDVKAFERQTWKPPAVRLREGKTKGCSNLIAVSISEVKKMLAVEEIFILAGKHNESDSLGAATMQQEGASTDMYCGLGRGFFTSHILASARAKIFAIVGQTVLLPR